MFCPSPPLPGIMFSKLNSFNRIQYATKLVPEKRNISGLADRLPHSLGGFQQLPRTPFLSPSSAQHQQEPSIAQVSPGPRGTDGTGIIRATWPRGRVSTRSCPQAAQSTPSLRVYHHIYSSYIAPRDKDGRSPGHSVFASLPYNRPVKFVIALSQKIH